MRVLGADQPGRYTPATHAIVSVIAFVAGLAGWLGSESDE
ncbi:hypothetical protein TL08_15315 [Actinoalloteichus hymeniacidonis]|uniref:Uncharacterized protein n=1 Tax=Actinoalloteichus hymeniacidonis TaxID=340345 RepID=A0AAC9MZA7_9PSEU|nr:hypothetical protein TL08_15315 [Actinoalloteichus hymeniacidonis]